MARDERRERAQGAAGPEGSLRGSSHPHRTPARADEAAWAEQGHASVEAQRLAARARDRALADRVEWIENHTPEAGETSRATINAEPDTSPLAQPPTIVIVGRPNVGKSTLFNRLTRVRRAITHDLPGVTRDRIAGDARRPGGGTAVIVDTGGFEAESDAPIPVQIRKQALMAVEGAAAVVLVVDGQSGLIPADEELAAALRHTGRPTVVAVNKGDRRDAQLAADEFSALGFPQVTVSAEHGGGISALWEELEPLLPPAQEQAKPAEELAIAIVGRPNVGKSSLLNRLLGEERVLVSEFPGTTRDAIDTIIEHRDARVRLIDTAGIRRKGRTDRGPEVLSVVMARRAIERADVCLLLVDASEGITAQDTHVAGHIVDAGRGVVVVVNKTDIMADGSRAAKRALEQKVLDHLKFLHDTPVFLVSVLTGAAVNRLLPAAFAVGRAFRARVGTGELNRVLRQAWERRPPPGGTRPPRLYYATQTGAAPPRFALFVSGEGRFHFSYMRYLENAVREAFPFAGVPIRFIMRGKRTRNA